MGKLNRQEARARRHRRLRQKVNGTAEVPRLSVCCTGKHIYVQLIDDDARRTLAAVSTLDAEYRKTVAGSANVAAAAKLGEMAAARAAAADISQVVFDRGGFRFHGRVKAIADAAREGGLKF